MQNNTTTPSNTPKIKTGYTESQFEGIAFYYQEDNDGYQPTEELLNVLSQFADILGGTEAMNFAALPIQSQLRCFFDAWLVYRNRIMEYHVECEGIEPYLIVQIKAMFDCRLKELKQQDDATPNT